MIFDNFVTNNQVITATDWNRAWGFNGTAKTLYDLLGAQQRASLVFDATSWRSSNQTISTSFSDVQFSFTNYTSTTRLGDFIDWSSGMVVTDNLRDGIVIHRNGTYNITCEIGIHDQFNRNGTTSTTADGPGTNINNACEIFLENNGTIIFQNTALPTNVNQAVGNATPAYPPILYSHFNVIVDLQKNDRINISTSLSDYTKSTRVAFSSLKIHLLRAT